MTVSSPKSPRLPNWSSGINPAAMVNMKYAHIERERRYIPISSTRTTSPIRKLHIHDRYIQGSTLRLRRIEEETKSTIFKMGQKIRVGGESPWQIAHTTMYLSHQEFELLSGLPAMQLEKHRSIFQFGDCVFAEDKFDGELTGLVLVEVDLGSDSGAPPALAFTELIEVTSDERFTGGSLAATSASDLELVLKEYGVK